MMRFLILYSTIALLVTSCQEKKTQIEHEILPLPYEIPITICDTINLLNSFKLCLCDTVRLVNYVANTFEGEKRIEKLAPTVSIKIAEGDQITKLKDGVGALDYVESVIYNKDRSTKLETISIAGRGGTNGVGRSLKLWIFERGLNQGSWYGKFDYSAEITGLYFPEHPDTSMVNFKWKNNYTFWISRRKAKSNEKEVSYYGIIGTEIVKLSRKQYLSMEFVGETIYNKGTIE